MSEAAKEDILMPVSPDHVLKQAEILAMRQIATQLEMLNRRTERVESHMDEVRQKVIRIEAQDHKQEISDVRALVGNNERRLRALELSVERYRGLFIPASVFASSLITGLAVFLLNAMLKASGAN